MNKKIICLVMLGVMIISVQPILPAMELEKAEDATNNSNVAEIVTVTIHAFKDENENGVQDSGEGDATNFIVKSTTKSPWQSGITYKGKTNHEGDLSFETENDPCLAIWVQQYSDSDRAQYKSDGAIGGAWDPIAEDDYDNIIIPLIKHERESISKPIARTFSNLIYQFPLLQQFLQRLPVFQ